MLPIMACHMSPNFSGLTLKISNHLNLENAIGHRGHGGKQEGHRGMRRRNRTFGSHLAGESKLSETSRPSLSL
jgi:hypothetical protein